MVLLLWCVCGGLLLHMFEANFLTILVKPNYEKAIDTAQDVMDRGLTVIWYPGSESLLPILKNSPANIMKHPLGGLTILLLLCLFLKVTTARYILW